MPPISGGFKQSARYVGYRPAQDNSRNWGSGVDPDHTRRDIPDPGFPPPVQTPYRQWTPPYLEDYFDPGADNLPYFPAAEQEPAGHDVPSVPSGFITDDQSQVANNAARSVYRGANTSRGRPTGQRQFDEIHHTDRVQSLPPQRGEPGPLTGQALRALRGRNSLAVNNPGSPEVNFSGNYVRQGFEIRRWVNRRMPMIGLTHTKRPLHLNLADAAVNRPGVGGSPYTSAYDSTPNMSKGTSRPWVRRQPRPWSEDAATDGTDAAFDGSEDFQSWGL